MNKLSLLAIIVITLFACSKEKEDVSPTTDSQPKSETPSGNIQEDLNNGWDISVILSSTPVDSFYGVTYQGGLIFYIDSINARGLISGTFDLNTLPSGITWSNGNNNYLVDASHTGIGEGRWNTDTITQKLGVSTFSQRYAAEKCDTLNLNDYSDWYLPSKDELNAMRTNLHLNGYGNFYQSIVYWSSSEIDLNSAWAVMFGNGAQHNFAKQNIANVRPIRRFGY